MQNKNNNVIEHEVKALETIYSQISSFDQKASILLSVLGILFGLSITLMDYVKTAEGDIRKFPLILLLCFWASISLSIFFSILVIIPRKKSKEFVGKGSLYYYHDLVTMSLKDFLLLCENSMSIDTLYCQIKEISKICKIKHKMLILSILFLIPTAATFFVFVYSVGFLG